MYPHLIVIGAPGSGKGTQATKLVSEFGYKHISTGDLLRAEVKSGSDLGKRVSDIMSRGDLVDDGTVLELLKKNCELSKNAYIFDGFPRNAAQAKMLSDVVFLGQSNFKAVYFDIDLAKLKERIVNRRTCVACGEIYNLLFKKPARGDGMCDKCGGALQHRKDDTEETVNNRLSVFRDATEPMLNYYKELGVFSAVNAMDDEANVFAALKKIINS